MMLCYLCGKRSAPVTFISGLGQVFHMCERCDKFGVFCETCETPISNMDDKFELPGVFGSPTGLYDCYACAEQKYDLYQEWVVA